MKSCRSKFRLSVLLLASACGAEGMDPSLTHYGDEVAESVDAVEESLASHHEVVLGESDLLRIGARERAHMDDVAMRMARMQDAQKSIESCSGRLGGAGHAEHADDIEALNDVRRAMEEAMQDVSEAFENHKLVMLDAPDLEAARVEERRHQAEMQGLVDSMSIRERSMRSAMQAMADDGFSMMCPMSSHMHRGG
jgi:seryl-tRNA synthetase